MSNSALSPAARHRAQFLQRLERRVCKVENSWTTRSRNEATHSSDPRIYEENSCHAAVCERAESRPKHSPKARRRH